MIPFSDLFNQLGSIFQDAAYGNEMSRRDHRYLNISKVQI